VLVPGKFVVTFKPGKEMEARVRQLEEEEFQRRLAAESGDSGKLPPPNPGSTAKSNSMPRHTGSGPTSNL
jgi:hypothetical protein